MSAETDLSPHLGMKSLAEQLGLEWDCTIQADDGTTIAQLRILTAETVRSLNVSSLVIKTLCAWRNKYRNCFFDTGQVTFESTLHWLLALTESPHRLLFLVHDNHGQPIAQYGLCRFSDDIVELDNGILGVSGSYPDLFLKIQLKVLELCRTKLGFREARARVIGDNIPALFLHKRCGLRKAEVLKHMVPDGRDVIIMSTVL